MVAKRCRALPGAGQELVLLLLNRAGDVVRAVEPGLTMGGGRPRCRECGATAQENHRRALGRCWVLAGDAKDDVANRKCRQYREVVGGGEAVVVEWGAGRLCGRTELWGVHGCLDGISRNPNKHTATWASKFPMPWPRAGMGACRVHLPQGGPLEGALLLRGLP